MNNKAQHWQTRTPLRVRVLGLLFFTTVLVVLGVLWFHWELFLGWYLATAVMLWLLLLLDLCGSPIKKLYFDDQLGFALLDSTGLVGVHIVHMWQSPINVAVLCVDAQNKKQRLVFWRAALSSKAWRQLHIYLLHYQLQHQFTERKGAR